MSLAPAAAADLAGAMRWQFERIDPLEAATATTRPIAIESPVAVQLNGTGYAVLMATPGELRDLAYGFLLGERLIDTPADVISFLSLERTEGVVLRIGLADRVAERIAARTRHRPAESGCGLCGVKDLRQALRRLPRLDVPCHADDRSIFAALDSLRGHQALNHATGAVHAAAACAADGTIRRVREDVGRHNAFDKLIGAMAQRDEGWQGGFALLSSRCSYELVEKAVLARCPMLVTISAPTSLALERAAAAGLKLRVLARADAMLASG